MKFDIHLNVGKIYRSANPRSIEMYYSGKEIAEYCNFFKITHAVVLYSEYEHIEEMQAHVENTKLYGVKWMVDFDNQELDIGKPLFYGVKLHSHRGYRSAKLYDREHPKRKNVAAADGELSYGLDYSDESVYLSKVLKKLPDNSLVYMHSQGSADPNNRAQPKHFLSLATKYCNLKFIMGHAGNYGGMGAAKPGKRDTPFELQENNSIFHSSMKGYLTSVAAFNESVLYANSLHNLFLDSSCFTHEKALALSNCDKWAIGSDYPFGGNSIDPQGNNFTVEQFKKRSFIWNYNSQMDRFINVMGKEKVEKSHENAIKYIETHVQQLAETHNFFT